MVVNLSETREFYRQFKSQLTAEVVAGSDKQLQYNNNGVLGASNNLVFDATNRHLNIGGSPFINNTAQLPIIQIGEIYRLYQTDTYTCGTFTNAAYGYNGNENIGLPNNWSSRRSIGCSIEPSSARYYKRWTRSTPFAFSL
ncbi:MAG: hypothetical protein F3739_04700 [Nitrospinae bacterium]|nr:hypothetical protein [Nitrospinota bacterium]